MTYADPHMAAMIAAVWVRYLRIRANLSFAPADHRWGSHHHSPNSHQHPPFGNRDLGIRRHIVVQTSREDVDLVLKLPFDFGRGSRDDFHDGIQLGLSQGIQVLGNHVNGGSHLLWCGLG